MPPQPTKKTEGPEEIFQSCPCSFDSVGVDFPDSVAVVARPFFFRVFDGGVPPLGVEAHAVSLRGHGGSEVKVIGKLPGFRSAWRMAP